jgi:simple sugar transport system permease protein
MEKKFDLKLAWNKFKSKEWFPTFTGSLLAILLGIMIGIILILILNPSNASLGIGRLLKGSFNHPRGGMIGFGQLLYNSTPIILTGLAVAFAFKTGLFNIGASGQYTLGLFAASLVGILGDSLGSAQWIVALLVGGFAGAIWGAIPGAFKAFFNVHEVITSIMFNYVGIYFVVGMYKSDFLSTRVINGTTNRTLVVDQAARTPYGPFNDWFKNSGLDIGILIAMLVAVVLYLVLYKTVFGRELRTVGLNKDAAKYSGVNEKKNIILSMAIAGFVAGLGGALFILAPSARNLGNAFPLEEVIASAGFDGIPVALLANNNPIAVIFTTFFVEYIKLGGSSMQSVGFVSEIVDIIVAIILYFSAFTLFMTQYFGKVVKKKDKLVIKKESDV